MSLLSFFRRAPRIADRTELAEFIDAQSAFVVQKGIYEYARARAGHYAKVLFGEPGFKQAVEVSRWRAFPLGIAMVTEVVEGQLRSAAVRDGLNALALSVFDRYERPDALDAATWAAARAELAQRLALIGLHPPKPAMDVPEPFIDAYFALMPVHEKLRTQDRPTTLNYLRVTLCNIHEEFRKRADIPALAASLRAAP